MEKIALFKLIKATESIFKEKMETKLDLLEIKGPMFVKPESGLNDELSGTEKPVSFKYQEQTYEIVQSLAKWKRAALHNYNFGMHKGLFVEMNAIRPNENKLSKYHSLHVDQYDWEKVISKTDRSINFLKKEVKIIYDMIYETKQELMKACPFLKNHLSKKLVFITSEKLEKMYPGLTPEKREYEFAKRHKAIFIIGIGHKLSNGIPHGLRAPDYDDWRLNGDLIVWDEVNNSELELSSMGIRVNNKSIVNQHKIIGSEEKLSLPFHKNIINNKCLLSIGGGIGRSRMNMFILERKHITEVK